MALSFSCCSSLPLQNQGNILQLSKHPHPTFNYQRLFSTCIVVCYNSNIEISFFLLFFRQPRQILCIGLEAATNGEVSKISYNQLEFPQLQPLLYNPSKEATGSSSFVVPALRYLSNLTSFMILSKTQYTHLQF